MNHPIVSKAVVIATGTSEDSGREVLGDGGSPGRAKSTVGWVGDSETEAFWSEFLRSLAAARDFLQSCPSLRPRPVRSGHPYETAAGRCSRGSREGGRFGCRAVVADCAHFVSDDWYLSLREADLAYVVVLKPHRGTCPAGRPRRDRLPLRPAVVDRAELQTDQGRTRLGRLPPTVRPRSTRLPPDTALTPTAGFTNYRYQEASFSLHHRHVGDQRCDVLVVRVAQQAAKKLIQSGMFFQKGRPGQFACERLLYLGHH